MKERDNYNKKWRKGDRRKGGNGRQDEGIKRELNNRERKRRK